MSSQSMLEEEFVFKVPRVRKRRPDLFCRESLSDLDEVWNSPSSSSGDCSSKYLHSDFPTRTASSGSLVRRSLNFDLKDEHYGSNNRAVSRNITELWDSNGTPSEVSHERDDFLGQGDSGIPYPNEPEEDWLNMSRERYTRGLWDEFNSHASHSQHVEELSAFFVPQSASAGSDKDSSVSLQSLHDDSDGDGYKFTTMEKNGKITPPQSPDVLIVRDESMANADSESSGSDLDWESLTPPAARSPGDHTVPDLGDLDFITPPSDFLLYPYDNLASVPQVGDLRISERSDNRQQHQELTSALHRRSSLLSHDHVVPDFYS